MMPFVALAKPTLAFSQIRTSPGSLASRLPLVAVVGLLPLVGQAAAIFLAPEKNEYSSTQLAVGCLLILVFEMLTFIAMGFAALKVSRANQPIAAGLGVIVTAFTPLFIAFAIMLFSTIFQPGSGPAAVVAIASLLLGLIYGSFLLSLGGEIVLDIPLERTRFLGAAVAITGVVGIVLAMLIIRSIVLAI